ncbi:hypothetical protein LEL_03378 [Akanthomyces lecanii RCEF 1005]|uniref:Uncharacterized protein n=1 Tax=Akanthomyces lecanii RCEF 1005 TaxID=1081108 RepID=A0A162KA44_CORDF|nr:hypothetical protein LEL_03378 [Akanthomyces lecanii RCEF 1005]
MARTRNSSRPSAENASAPRQNPSRTSKSRITQLADLPTSSEPSSEDSVTDAESPEYSELDADGNDFVFGADETAKAPRIPVRTIKLLPAQRRRSRARKQKRSIRKISPGSRKGSKTPPKRKRRDTSPAHSSRSKRFRQSPKEEREPIIYSDIIPDWKDPRIPVECWLDIFYYAASDGTPGNIATNWLLQVVTSCHFFAEPALDTLYRCPTIRHAAKAKKLASLLEQPVAETKFNYRSKIETLHLDIHVVPASIMYQLIQPLPRLRELIICTPYDQPPYRELERSLRWHYSAEIFQALLPGANNVREATLKPYHTQLKSWEWSGRLVGGYVEGLKDISRIHQLPSFATLTRVSFTNFQTPSLRKREPRNDDEAAKFLNEDNANIEAIAASLTKLPALSHLVFESSTVMNDHMLTLLPRGLLHLELINCWEIRSFELAAFLRDKGGEMRILSLHHNQSLDLGFLTDLADTCPKLRELDMNLSYYKIHESSNDSDPMYDQALLPDQVPRWPSSIRVINLEYIRDWSVETAEMFLQTLIDNAHNLSNLRYLSVRTMLDIPWQSRATMRTTWRAKMEKVFLRRSPEPPQNFRTLRPKTLGQDTKTPAHQSSNQGSVPPTSPSRRSTRIIELENATSEKRKSSLRDYGRSRRDKSYRDPDSDEDELSDSKSSEDNASSAGSDATSSDRLMPVHGLCKTVNIVFDNQKVRELQYGMEDFQTDSHGPDDDEWEGDYESDDPVLQF